MKKLTGMKKNFSSLENKKLSNPGSINGGTGGTETNERWSEPTCNPQTYCSDYHYYKDGVVVGGGDSTKDCIIASF